jgi:hypothetical protein
VRRLHAGVARDEFDSADNPAPRTASVTYRASVLPVRYECSAARLSGKHLTVGHVGPDRRERPVRSPVMR